MEGSNKKIGRAPDFAPLTVDLAGNAQNLADLASVAVPLVYLLQFDFFSKGWYPAELPAVGLEEPRGVTVLNDMNQRELRRLFTGQPLMTGNDEPDDDMD